jgi:hypothetical protein
MLFLHRVMRKKFSLIQISLPMNITTLLIGIDLDTLHPIRIVVMKHR